MKILLNIFLSICLLSFILCHNNVKSKMEEHGIVPDVIDKAPTEQLKVTYPEKEVQFGNELTPLQVKDEPKIEFKLESPTTFYTLLMVDPDAPSRQDPKFGEVRHWFVGNIENGDVKTGDHITEYVGSGPPKGTGLHRYIFLLYKQNGKIQFDEPKTTNTSRAHRLNFSTRKFVEKYKLGEPVSGNFYLAQWDEYVEIRNKNISN